MKNTPEIRRAFEQLSVIAALTGYKVDYYTSTDEERIYLSIYEPKDTEDAAYPAIRCNNPRYANEPISFEIMTTSYSDHSINQAHRVIKGLNTAVLLVDLWYKALKAAGIKCTQF